MRKKTTFVFLSLVLFGMAFTAGQIAKAEFDDVIPFLYGMDESVPAFDPQAFYDTTSSDVAINHLEGLYAINYTDPAGAAIPRLAADFGSWNTAGTEWTIPLRTDVKWHDGTAFTADDVIWNWDRLNYLASESLSDHAGLWYSTDDGNLILNHTEKVDDHTIKFVLNKQWMDFELLQTFAGCFMIQPIEGKEEILIENDEYALLVGTGPFKLWDYTAGEDAILVANNKYYRGAPDIQKLIFKVYADSTAYNNALMAKECHAIRSVLHDNKPIFDADPELAYGVQKGQCVYSWNLNVNNIPWSVRKALQFCFDYDYNANVRYDGQVIEHHSPVPDGMFGYNGDLPGLPYYNITLAREYLLNDPAYSGHEIQTYNISEDDEWLDLADSGTPLISVNFTGYRFGLITMLMDNARYCGIEIEEISLGSWANFVDADLFDQEIVYGGWCPDYNHPINQIEPLFQSTSGNNWCGLNNSTIDATMAQAHLLSGAELQANIDECVTMIVVEQAAAMHTAQSTESPAWLAELVTNVDDFFNSGYEKYFFSVQFALTDAPTDTGIPGFAMVSLMLSTVATALFLFFKKRN
jgi:ABC-type transport system substrate-binding protein